MPQGDDAPPATRHAAQEGNEEQKTLGDISGKLGLHYRHLLASDAGGGKQGLMRSQYPLEFKIASANLVDEERQKTAGELSNGNQVGLAQQALSRILTKESMEDKTYYQKMRRVATKAWKNNKGGSYPQAACAPIGKRIRAPNYGADGVVAKLGELYVWFKHQPKGPPSTKRALYRKCKEFAAV